MEEGTIFVGLQVYPGPGAKRVKFFGSLTVLFEVPASPTITSKTDCPQAATTPPLQQCVFSIVRYTREKVYNCRDFLAAMRYNVSFEPRTVSLFCCLSS
jgi:hypothetical protein